MKLASTFLLAVILALNLCACNTIKGVGKDIEKGGAAIQKAAD